MALSKKMYHCEVAFEGRYAQVMTSMVHSHFLLPTDQDVELSAPFFSILTPA